MERAKVEEDDDDEDTLYSTEFYVELNLVGNQNSFRKNSANHPTIPRTNRPPSPPQVRTYDKLHCHLFHSPLHIHFQYYFYHYSLSVFALWNLGACLFLSYIMMGLLLVCCCCCCFIFFCCCSSCCSCM